MPKKASTNKKADFAADFRAKLYIYQKLHDEALFSLKDALSEASDKEIKIHSIIARVKDEKSFCEKIERKQYDRPFEQTEDIVGVRIVCLFLSQIDAIETVINKCFKVIRVENKIKSDNPSSFGYMSVHYLVEFTQDNQGPRYRGITGITFEIQVRTIAMEAWANVSHYLAYKSDQEIPTDLKRDFNALSGMFYVADRHFQQFFEQRREKQEEIAEVFEKGNVRDKFQQSINFDTLAAYARAKFPDREEYEVSGMVNELIEAGFKTIGEIDSLVETGYDTFLEYERKYPPFAKDGHRYADMGVLRGIGKIFSDTYWDVYRKKFPNATRDSYLEFKKN